MTTTTTEAPVMNEEQHGKAFAEKLMQETCGCSLSCPGPVLSRSMNDSQLAKVAASFEADQGSVGGSKKILDAKHPLVARIRKIQRDTRALVKVSTRDYPERGLRLVKTSKIQVLHDLIEEAKSELAEACAELAEAWESVKAERAEALGDLYDPSDYHFDPATAWKIAINFPEISPDKRLLELHPELYEAEAERIKAKFAEAVLEAEAAAVAQIEDTLSHLVDKLAPDENGEIKTLRGSALTNIQDFVAQFKEISIGEHAGLDSLVDEIGEFANGLDPKQLRKASPEERAKVKEAAARLLEKSNELIVARPKRKLDLED